MLWSDCAYVRADLSICWSHIPHFWKSHVMAQHWNFHQQLNILNNKPMQFIKKALIFANTPISPRIILVPIVPDLYIWLIGRISWKPNGDLRTITGNHLGRSGKVWLNRLSPTRVGYRKSDRLLFLNMFKNSSRPEPVGSRSSWSSEGPLKVFLSRLPSGAFVYPLELSSTLGSFRNAPQLSLPVILRKVFKIIDIS